MRKAMLAIVPALVVAGCAELNEARLNSARKMEDTAKTYRTSARAFTELFRDASLRRDRAVRAVVEEQDRAWSALHTREVNLGTATQPALSKVIVATQAEFDARIAKRDLDLLECSRITAAIGERISAFEVATDELVEGVSAFVRREETIEQTNQRMTRVVEGVFQAVGVTGTTLGVTALAGGL